MSQRTVDPQWLAALQAYCQRPPLRARVALLARVHGQEHQVGSVEPDLFKRIGLQDLWIRHGNLVREELAGQEAWILAGDIQAILTALALALRASGMAGAWRAEALAVYSDTGQVLGSIERAAVRPLGIATQAVHLVGLAGVAGPQQRVWVQQRSFRKASDPGMWDTLVGGMLSAADTLESALQRETWEEAGLRLEQLGGLQRGGRIEQNRPLREAAHPMGDAGYLVEQVHWYACSVPDPVKPSNRDGEVQAFALLGQDEMIDMLEGDLFTPEAAQILVQALALAGARSAPR